MKQMRIDDYLSKDEFDSNDQHPHIIVDSEQCLTCEHKACTKCCPAERYKWDKENRRLIFDHVGCLECGCCRLICERLNQSLEGYSWNYPENGEGVLFKEG
ncbi:MAG: hypothetical protein LKJ43_05190 [Lentilactobacillus buchneri]|jgi:ferredoxin like protein|nr:4Fe-4S ferredoxin [Sporolactobacillus sp.]MCI1882590.1 4Fe-4S ferredoxin [Sporolactobacillus sp.]MCI1951110.1 hypothetical protein [Lentilactobacillus buchneri]